MKIFLKKEGISFYEDLKSDNDKIAEIVKSKKGKEKRLQKKTERARAKKYD
ncbi:MAG: Unknown protein [uncultured Aureispira sp.]|uniref:Uncharacterized protein n=1 Tax=uncultured Aureispira sp. TaxID=1331704 RepID=A0A6S6SM65_9BACT|nr:MAG: Unknown protein [uncultured Aureispira sp.]